MFLQRFNMLRVSGHSRGATAIRGHICYRSRFTLQNRVMYFSQSGNSRNLRLWLVVDSLQTRVHPKCYERRSLTAHSCWAPCYQQDLSQLFVLLLLRPQWADTRRATASAVFRSALFPALGRGQRQYLERQKIFSTRGVEVFFTGKQFDQSDLDVYLEILHLLKDIPSRKCCFTAYGLLKALGRSTGYKDHQWLHSVLIRLTACAVDMTDGTKRYFGPLLEGGIKDEITKHYTIRVNPDFAALFKRSWSSLEHEQRRQLKGNPTAQALHAY